MVSVGYLFLCDSLISLWKRNVEAVIPIDQAPVWVQQLARILRLLLLASIGTILASSIMSAGMYNGSAPPSESEISQVAQLRHASYCTSLGKHFACSIDSFLPGKLTVQLFPLCFSSPWSSLNDRSTFPRRRRTISPCRHCPS